MFRHLRLPIELITVVILIAQLLRMRTLKAFRSLSCPSAISLLSSTHILIWHPWLCLSMDTSDNLLDITIMNIELPGRQTGTILVLSLTGQILLMTETIVEQYLRCIMTQWKLNFTLPMIRKLEPGLLRWLLTILTGLIEVHLLTRSSRLFL